MKGSENAGDWVEVLMRDYQDKLTHGLYEAMYGLDGASIDALMEGQARTCVSAFVELAGLPVPMDLGAFLQKMRTAGPSRIEIRREGDTIYWREQHKGECVCPLVRRSVIRLDPKLCVCGEYWVQYLFESVAHTPVDVETVATVATGAEDCEFRITLKRAGKAQDETAP